MADGDELVAGLYLRHHAEAVRLAWALCGDAGQAEELAQEAFARLQLHRRALRDPAAAPAYLRRIVINLAHDANRGAGRRRELTEVLARQATEVHPAPDLAEHRALLDAVATLPRRRRACVVLRYYLDLSEVDTAAALGISVGTVKSQTHRALAQLRQLLDPSGDPAGLSAIPTRGEDSP